MTIPTMDPRGIDGGVKSVLTALDVLDCFATAPELGVTDIARRLGVAKSTAHRLLTTLGARGLVEHVSATGQYRLGLHLVELGWLVEQRSPLNHQAAVPTLECLRRETGQSVQLVVGAGGDAVTLEHLPSLRGGRHSIPLDARRLPAHLTSAGKVLAAFDRAVEDARIAAGFPMPTPRSIGGALEFGIALEQVRRTGFAVVDGEAREGVASVAVPVRDVTGRATAALALLGPSDEILTGVGRFVEVLSAAASNLGRLGVG